MTPRCTLRPQTRWGAADLWVTGTVGALLTAAIVNNERLVCGTRGRECVIDGEVLFLGPTGPVEWETPLVSTQNSLDSLAPARWDHVCPPRRTSLYSLKNTLWEKKSWQPDLLFQLGDVIAATSEEALFFESVWKVERISGTQSKLNRNLSLSPSPSLTPSLRHSTAGWETLPTDCKRALCASNKRALSWERKLSFRHEIIVFGEERGRTDGGIRLWDFDGGPGAGVCRGLVRSHRQAQLHPHTKRREKRWSPSLQWESHFF